MSAYIMDCVCFTSDFPSIRWKWNIDVIDIFGSCDPGIKISIIRGFSFPNLVASAPKGGRFPDYSSSRESSSQKPLKTGQIWTSPPAP